MMRKPLFIIFSTILSSCLLLGIAFAEPLRDIVSKIIHSEGNMTASLPEEASLEVNDKDDSFEMMSSSTQEPSLREGVETGKWGTCNWEWDHSTETITVYPGKAGEATYAPWYASRFPSSNPNGGVKHIVFVKEGNNKVVFPAICKHLFGSVDSVQNYIESIDFSGVDTSNVTSMRQMFYLCANLRSLDLSSFNTSKVTTMQGMFNGCFILTSLNVSSFNTSNVTDMSNMFGVMRAIPSLDLSNFNTSKVTNMRGMFNACRALTFLNVSSFNTANVTNMRLMFSVCPLLTSLDISNFNTKKLTDYADMFTNSNALESIKLGVNTTKLGDFPSAEINERTDWYSEATSKWFTASEITSKRLGTVDTYTKGKPFKDSTVSAVVDKFFVGEEVKQDLTITYDGVKLVENTDYKITYKDNINVGTASMTIEGLNEYAGTISKEFKIKETDINTVSISGIEDKPHTGQAITLSLVLKNGNYTLKENVDYTLTYSNNIEIGTASITIKGIGGYTGEATRTFSIDPKYKKRATVPYGVTAQGALSAEVTVDTSFGYLDFSPEIDITYSWDEDLEWIYVKKGQYGFWTKGKDEESALENAKKISSLPIAEASLDELSDDTWKVMSDTLADFAGAEGICKVIHFHNNSYDHGVYVSLQEQAIVLPSTEVHSKTIEGTTITPDTGTSNRYLQYRSMMPYAAMTSKTTVLPINTSHMLTSSLSIGTSTALIPEWGDMKGNEAYIGINPNPVFKPSTYKPWIAENRADNRENAAISAQLKLIFTKIES